MNHVKTDFLVSAGSFIIGAGTIMNLGGSYFHYNISPTGEEADMRAIYGDWRVIGQEMEKVAATESKRQDPTEESQMTLALS
jgi:hypothetical protein